VTSLPIDLFDALGLAGAALFVFAFAGMQFEKLDPHQPPALLMNLIGAVLILVSLVHDFNLAAFVLETIWGLVAIYGLVKYMLRRRRGG
jgi:hypothetical protein